MVKPTLKNSALNADAMPLLFEGTAPMTELMSGMRRARFPLP